MKLTPEHVSEMFVIGSNLLVALPTMALTFFTFRGVQIEEHRHEERMQEIRSDEYEEQPAPDPFARAAESDLEVTSPDEGQHTS